MKRWESGRTLEGLWKAPGFLSTASVPANVCLWHSGVTAQLIHSVFIFFIRQPRYSQVIAKLTYVDRIFTAVVLLLFDRKAFCHLLLQGSASIKGETNKWGRAKRL